MAPTNATNTTATATASSSPSDAAENVAAVLEKTTSDPRFTRGLTLLKEKRLEEAVVVYEDLLRTMIETENQSDSLAVAPVYYQYGHAMLLLAEATASVFGGSVAPPEDGSGDNDAEQDAKNTADDLEVAWEMLEVARVIYSRFPNDLAVEKELARVYMRLGDLGMESDVFEQARSDYEKSLALRQKILTATQDPDTTLLADLYCCLAISCIYQESKQPEAEDGNEGNDNDGDTVEPGARQEEIRQRESEGLTYYVLAGRVMAENIHRVARSCAAEFQAFVAARIPSYTSANGDDDDAKTTTTGKGKGKLKPTKPELRFTADGMDSVRDAFLACAQVLKGGGDAESLTPDEAQLLEYVEIYVELKEKVDGILESASAEAVDASASASASSGKRGPDALDDDDAYETKAAAVTTIGFGVSETATTATAVNVVSVKKRKVAPTAAAKDESESTQ